MHIYAAQQHDQGVHPLREGSDTALLEDALREALAAHAAGQLAAPFGLDEVALRKARREAARRDTKKLARGDDLR
jgi:hypothetical protein